MKSIAKLSSALSLPCHDQRISTLRSKHLFVWMFHANQHANLCNQNFHGKPCHNCQKHGWSWNAIFNQDRLLRSSGATCESVCPLDLLPSMCIFVHILAVEVKTYIFNAFLNKLLVPCFWSCDFVLYESCLMGLVLLCGFLILRFCLLQLFWHLFQFHSHSNSSPQTLIFIQFTRLVIKI